MRSCRRMFWPLRAWLTPFLISQLWISSLMKLSLRATVPWALLAPLRRSMRLPGPCKPEEGGFMKPDYFGTEEVVAADLAYNGSTFSEVRDALFANPYQTVWGQEGQPALPVYQVTLGSVLYGVLPFGKPYLFPQATERALDSPADLRWGQDGKGFRRLLHPNGVWLAGLLEITEATLCLGYFRKGRREL